MSSKTLVPNSRFGIHPWLASADELFNVFFSDSRLPASGNTADRGVYSPRVDIAESDTAYEITAEFAGLGQQDIEVTIDNGILSLKGEKSAVQEQQEKNYYRKERVYGSFERSFRLPEEVEVDKVEAEFKNGVLSVGLPKSENAQSTAQEVAVKAG